MENAKEWYLVKVDEEEAYGPVELESLKLWAAEAKISPMDRLSYDGQKTWLRAPMVPDLQMDWLVELEDGYLYGPTTAGTIQEFLANGEIDHDTVVINCLDNTQDRIGNLSFLHTPLRQAKVEAESIATRQTLGEARIGESIQQKVIRLEQLVLHLRKELVESESRYHNLRAQFEEYMLTHGN